MIKARAGAASGTTQSAGTRDGRALATGRDDALEPTNKTPDLLVIQDAPAESDCAARGVDP